MCSYIPMRCEASTQIIIANNLRAALTSNSGYARENLEQRDKEEKTVIPDSALTLLEVESACQHRLRCGIGRSSKLAWLHIIGIAPSTPREDILELMAHDLFIPADES